MAQHLRGARLPRSAPNQFGLLRLHVRYPAYWRHMGWGEPAAFNHVVSYVYAAANTGNGDPGDIFYIRSSDSGVTFSAPFPTEYQRRANQGAVAAQPLGQRSWHPPGHVVGRGTKSSGQLPAEQSKYPVLPDAFTKVPR